MDLFLEMSNESLFESDAAIGEDLVSDEEIDRMIGLEPDARKKMTREELDREIAKELGEDLNEEKNR